jgi:hydroxymethylpyrimidine pyrophosphatase-like HAD family hydrolase
MTIQRTNKVYTFKVIPVLLLFIWLISFYGMGSYGISKGLRPLVRGMENKIVLYKTRNLKETETDTFIFRYEDINRQTLELIKDTAEDKYKEIIDIFQYEFKDKILVIVYDNADLMMETTMLRKGDPPMGVYYGNSVHILNPELWVKMTGEIVQMWDSDSKHVAIMEFVEKYDIDLQSSYAYGDTIGDYSMLKLVGNPVAINPTKELLQNIRNDEELRKRAIIIVERKDVIYKLTADIEFL